MYYISNIDSIIHKVTLEDLDNAWIDEFGVRYSQDRKRLLRAPCGIISYAVMPGTEMICDDAFFNTSLQTITLPNSVTSIGNKAFFRCESLQTITLSNSVTNIGFGVFAWCKSLQSITLPNSVESIEHRVFYECRRLQRICIPTHSRAKFEKLLPNDGFRLVEIENKRKDY